jgi:hypothetical protein
LAVASISGLTYWSTLSAVPALTHDSAGYLMAIEAGGKDLFHPHHLAYNALARGWLETLDALGIGGDPLRLVELMSAVVGAGATALVWTILRLRAQLPRPLAAAGTAGAALSYGFWFYSVSVEVYLLPLAFLLAAFLVLTGERQSVRTMVALGALNGAAVVAHQVNVLFALVVAIVVARRIDRTRYLRRIGVYAGTATAVVGVAYGSVLAFAIRPGSLREAADWLTRYAQEGGYWHITPSASLEAAAGFGRALVGGHFAFRLDAVRSPVESLFPGKSLEDETYLVRNLPAPLAVALLAATLVGAGILLTIVIRGIARRRSLPPPAGRMLAPLVTWLAVYSALFVVWEPLNPEFWIPQATALWMIAAVMAASPGTETAPATQATTMPGEEPSTGRAPRLLVAAAAAIGFVNLVGTILPATAAHNDIYAVRYEALAELVDADDLVVVDHPHLGVGYTGRFTAAEAVVVSEYTWVVGADDPAAPPLGDVVDRLERSLAAGNRVAIDAHLLLQPTGQAAARAGRELAARYADRWRYVEVPGALGWCVVDP